MSKYCTFLIVGGGISGVSCLETIQFLAPEEKTILITESSLVKSVTKLVQLGKFTQRFEVQDSESRNWTSEKVEIIKDRLRSIDSKHNKITTENGIEIKYKFLCLCSGASPKLVNHPELKDSIIGIRDTETVKEFQNRIKNSKRFVLLGNGGIASEIAHEINNISIEWVIKDNHVSSTFIDPAASKFFENKIKDKSGDEEKQTIIKRMRYSEDSKVAGGGVGAALGPDWHHLLDMSGNSKSLSNNVKIHYNCELKSAAKKSSGDFPLEVELTNGSKIDCDFIVSATGVVPSINYKCDVEFKLGADGGIFVDEMMKTSVDSIFAAGDVCCAGWEHSQYWFQMRLWTQARQMGAMAGKSMVASLNNETIYQDFCFELFSHVTKLYGYQIVLLGKYNGQGLEKHEILLRITPDTEYVKFVTVDGKLHGALLIGETGLEETCENLILNKIDLTPYGEDILNPNIDIEDYFD